MGSVWHLHPLRVRYQETDRMGVVYHANYVNWFEIGRTEWVRQAGYTYKEIEARGLLLPVIHLEASFEQPAQYDDWVTVCTRVAEMTPIRVRFESRIVRGDRSDVGLKARAAEEPPGETLVQGGTKHVWLNAAWKPARLDREAPDVWAAMRALVEAPGGRG
ncbi:thioesterase family protein [Cohnella sp. REN36]|uniref:acyl-CoA thioesterase n=1 Tax=Cohnella sp. REN36 TaxID=2887347 RepID=UPI001D15DDF1|nr:thioesterase family protein [Cohnella sp. REN36]MCC3375903.1 acyl-CoA thioesterase [Cohnella sp. REN36]